MLSGGLTSYWLADNTMNFEIIVPSCTKRNKDCVLRATLILPVKTNKTHEAIAPKNHDLYSINKMQLW